MKDTSNKINDLQLQIWLAKTPSERLYQLLMDNEALYSFWKNLKPTVENKEKQFLDDKTI